MEKRRRRLAAHVFTLAREHHAMYHGDIRYVCGCPEQVERRVAGR